MGLLGLILILNMSPLSAYDVSEVRGVVISCQGSGRVWGTDAFAEELPVLKELGVNWIAIHPYARINADGSVRWRPYSQAWVREHIARPVREAHRLGLAIAIKPHLAYWGGPFSWRGEITFDEAAARERFFRTYSEWILEIVRLVPQSDIFIVGTELDKMLDDRAAWLRLIGRVRELSGAKLTYAANWDAYQKVPFWDALDFVGIQAYFPVTDKPNPADADLRAGWTQILKQLKTYHERHKKPVLFTEFGYNRSLQAAARPWEYHQAEGADRAAATELQVRCLEIGLSVLQRERAWLHGAFLWKWFVGPAPYENFLLNTNEMKGAIGSQWRKTTGAP